MTYPTQRLLDETRVELAHADGKANVLFGALGVGSSVLIAGLVSRDIRFAAMTVFAQAMAFAAAAMAALALVQIALAVWPRCGTPEPGRARYFAEINQFNGDVTAVQKAIANDTEAGDRNVSQLVALSALVATKYRKIQLSTYWALGASVAAALAAIAY